MSQKDLQFIERALAHPWMFWVYFWKWPRIVRQACAEYDLLAKERDAAKAAHERSERANKIVRDWIHVTHRLSTTPEAIRAIFAAGKRLSILLVFFVVTNTYGQAPPYLRNQWTTNLNPLALKVISTNGVHAATNIWELDFTNTATVTVSAVSNANKVMVSFTGSASSTGSSLTNALLHAGPTNGSVDALILTAGNGVTLTTSGTNRIAAIDTNVVAEISDLVWTNDASIGSIHPIGSTNVQVLVDGTIIASNGFKGSVSSIVSNGGFSGGLFYSGYSRAGQGGFAGGYLSNAVDSYIEAGSGGHAGGYLFDGSTNSFVRSESGASAGGYFFGAPNCIITANEGGKAGGCFDLSTDCTVDADGGAVATLYTFGSVNCDAESDRGGFAGGYMTFATNSYYFALNGGRAGGYIEHAIGGYAHAERGGFAGINSTASEDLPSDRSYSKALNAGVSLAMFDNSPDCFVLGESSGFGGAEFYSSSFCQVSASSGSYSGGLFDGSTSSGSTSQEGSHAGGYCDLSQLCLFTARRGGISVGQFIRSTNSLITADGGSHAGGYLLRAKDSFLKAERGSYAGGYLSHATTLTNSSVWAQDGSIASGVSLANNEQIYAGGAVVGALAVGRDVVSTNNWTFGIHYTNAIPLSLAVGADGTTQFRAASNSVVIRSATAPTVGQILTATDTSGTVGWSNAPAASGGGIASVYTNNVLAGGPGLTELEFTNTSSVTWVATTNAGRVTMSATSVGGGSGIATNEGTGFKTTFYGQTNFGNITFTNGARIEQPTATITRFTNSTFNFGGNITFTPHATYMIGSALGSSPSDIFSANQIITENYFGYRNNGGFYKIGDGLVRFANEAGTDVNGIQFGGTSAAIPKLAKVSGAGHLAIRDGTDATSTNCLIFGNTINTTASTGMTMNRQTGRVRLSAGNQTYLVTNNLATANSIVTATINSDDTTAVSVKAIPAAGVITLKANAATTADTDISFFISSP